MFKHIKMQDDKNLLEKGFTLIELLVVVAILGILAAVAIFAVGNLTDNAKKNACATEAATVQTAADAWNAKEAGSATPRPVTIANLTSAEGNLKSDPVHDVGGADGYTYDGATGQITQQGANCTA